MPAAASESPIARARRLRPRTRVGQAVAQRGVVGVDAEADDVDGLAGEADRDLDAGQVVEAGCTRGGRCAVLATDFVVVGQRPQARRRGPWRVARVVRGRGCRRRPSSDSAGRRSGDARGDFSWRWLGHPRAGLQQMTRSSAFDAHDAAVGAVGEQVDQAVGALAHVADALAEIGEQRLARAHRVPCSGKRHTACPPARRRTRCSATRETACRCRTSCRSVRWTAAPRSRAAPRSWACACRRPPGTAHPVAGRTGSHNSAAASRS